MKKFKSVFEAHQYYRGVAFNEHEEKVNLLGFSTPHLIALEVDQLRLKISEIDEILGNSKKLNETGEIEFDRDEHFQLPKDADPGFGGFIFTIGPNLIAKKKEILDLIKTKEREIKIESISELIQSISEPGLKKKFSKELKELEDQANRIEIEEKQLDEDEKRMKSIKEELEITKSKLDVFDKKSQIWLRILGRESVASILGGVILLLMCLSLLLAMFFGLKPSTVIESAFLLILGYFFGHSVSKKSES